MRTLIFNPATPPKPPDGKTFITALELEDLFYHSAQYGEIPSLENYVMKSSEITKALKKLSVQAGSLFHRAPYTHLLKTLIPFIRDEAKKNRVTERIILSDMLFSETTLQGCNLQNVTIKKCRFKGSQFKKTCCDHVVMENCVFDEAKFNNAHCEQTEFRDCQFNKCSFEEMYISQNTVFQNALFKFKPDEKINAIYYYQTEKKDYVALNPNEYYNSVKKTHHKLLTEKRKSELFHGFFEKTDKQLDHPKQFSLAAIFSFFLDTLLGRKKEWRYHNSSKSFLGTLLIEKQRRNNKKGVTVTAVNETLQSLPPHTPPAKLT